MFLSVKKLLDLNAYKFVHQLLHDDVDVLSLMKRKLPTSCLDRVEELKVGNNLFLYDLKSIRLN